jgi:formyl-CoA transferase
MALFNESRQWRGFLSALGCDHLADDPRFATSASRKQNASALVQVLDAVFAQQDLADWRKLLDAAGVTFGAVGSVNETSDDGQMQQIGALVPFADGMGLTVSSPFHIDGETKVAPRRAPSIGQHTDEVLREAGYSADEIRRLRALGVLG